MLSMYNVGGSGTAGSYYEKADDYYTKDKSPSEWQGKAAEALGLSGPVSMEDFKQLLDGNLPNGEYIKLSAGHRGGTDLTFSAPKSVSMQALIGGDERLIEAHDKAVSRSLAYAETLVAYRYTKDGETNRVMSGNMAAATFRHELSRACDPQLHTHCVVLNLTQREDGKWRAMDNELLYRQKMLMGAFYRSELAREVQELGYEVRRTREDGLFELSHLSHDQLEKFSERSRAVEEALENKGKSREEVSAQEKKIITLATRPQKTDVDRQALREYWQEKSLKAGISYEPQREREPKEHERRPALESVAFAMEHATERQAVITEDRLVRAALEHGVGRTTYEEIKKELKTQEKSQELIRSGERYTTKGAQEREKALLAIERDGRGAGPSILPREDIFLELREKGLNEGQQDAAALILTTENQVVGVQGLAGTGKTHMLNATRELAERQNYKVRGLAPSTAATQELEKTGIESQTLAAFEHTKDKELNDKTLLVVDEAGMVSAKQMQTVLREAERHGAKVALVGDQQQLKAVEAGKPFAQLQAHGMATAGMSEIRRQNNPELKRAVEYAARGDINRSVALMEKRVKEIQNPQERYESMAKDYAALTSEERENTLMISGTNKARKAINEQVRKELGLEGQGSKVETLERRDLTQAQRKQIESYQVGDYVKPHRNYRSLGLKKGELCRVHKVEKAYLILEKPDGTKRGWEPERQSKFSAYRAEQRELAAGDRVRVTENDRERGLANGDFAKVKSLEKDQIHLERDDGKEFKLDRQKPLHVEHNYCSTVDAAQGKTCERVFMDADTQSITAEKGRYYVALSRAREEAKIYTNDFERLPQAMSRENVKEAALEVSRSRERTGKQTERSAPQPALAKERKTKVIDYELDR